MYPREFGVCDEASASPLEQCGITNVTFVDQGMPSSLPDGITPGMVDNVEIPNSYIFDGTAASTVDGTIVNNLLRSNTTIVFATWIQINSIERSYIYCMGRVYLNYRYFCIYYRPNGRMDLFYQRQYQSGIDRVQSELRQLVRVVFNPADGVGFDDMEWHFYQLQLTYRPNGDVTLEMFIDGVAMRAFVVRFTDENGNDVEPDIPDDTIVTLPFRPEPVSTEATDMVAFLGGRYNRDELSLHGRLGRVLIFPYPIDSTSLNCYTSCNELLFVNGPTSPAIITSYDGINRTLHFDGAASLTEYITLLQQIAFSTSNPISGTKRYVKLQVSR